MSNNRKKTTKIERLRTALESGRTVTSAQAVSRFGYSSPNAVRGAITKLREYGMSIETIPTRTGFGYSVVSYR